MLGLEPAAEERDERQALRRHHGDLLVNVLELRSEVRSLQRRIRAAKEVAEDATLLTNRASLRRAESRRSASAGGTNPAEGSPRLANAEAAAAGAAGAGDVVLSVGPEQPVESERNASKSSKQSQSESLSEAADKEEPLGLDVLLG